jgi:hypothetical protein
MMTEVSLSIPVIDGRMALGTWQGVYLIEHRAAPHERNIALSFLGHLSRRTLALRLTSQSGSWP